MFLFRGNATEVDFSLWLSSMSVLRPSVPPSVRHGDD